jgi:hypothetical protein
MTQLGAWQTYMNYSELYETRQMKWEFNSSKALNSVTSRLNRFEPIQIKGSTPP